MFRFYEYNNLQIKQRSNSKMLYQSYLETLHLYNLQYRYKMLWQKHKSGYELLAKENLKTKKREYIGRRDKNTEEIANAFRKNKQEIKERLKNLKEQLKRDQKLNKIENITRALKELVAILRKINELDLDKKLIVIGTNSLYAYEARAGIMIEEEHLATRDIDILNRKDKKVSFMFNLINDSKLAIDLLQSIDKSFYQSPKAPYRFINKDGIWVEIITPSSVKKDKFLTDVILQWLENARLFSETIIGDDGKSANLTTIHPLEFAIYKNWLSKQEDRDFIKHTRDKEQSRLVTKIIVDYMPNIDISQELDEIKHIPKKLIESYKNEILKEFNLTQTKHFL